MKAIDLTGHTFGRLTVLRFEGRRGALRMYRCSCACGAEVVIPTGNLRTGHTNSCGCLARERRLASNTTHGQALRGRRTAEYRTWIGMLDRCRRPAFRGYQYYGGRGIAVCERWATSFETFLADMGPKPSRLHSIERINNDGDYEPGNCRWATRAEQLRNTSRSRVIEINGERANLEEWATRSPASSATITRRLDAGWSPEAAVFTAPGPRGRRS